MRGEQTSLVLIDGDTGQVILPLKEAYREHTAERWKEEDPLGYAECIECINRGEVNVSQLADKFGRSRQTIRALKMREFSVEQLRAINGKLAAIVVQESLAQQSEVIPDAKVKDLGALAMASKAGTDVSQLLSGGPTEIVENRSLSMTVDEYKAWLAAQKTGLGTGKNSAFSAGENEGSK